MDIDLKQLRELMRAMKQLDVNELEIEAQNQRIYLRRGSDGAAATAFAPAAAPSASGSIPPPSYAPAPGLHAASAEDANTKYITSPFVGTFYRSPSPDDPPFVEAGARIERGQVLCIVEAMKLMNEIEAEIAGTIVEVLVENGKPVEFGDKLFKVRTS